jgi:hypothetical protein
MESIMKQGPKPRKKLRILEYGLACLIRAMKGNNDAETVRWATLTQTTGEKVIQTHLEQPIPKSDSEQATPILL